MEGTKMFMGWLKMNIDAEVLPTTFGQDMSARSSTGDVMDWIRTSISSATDILGLGNQEKSEAQKIEQPATHEESSEGVRERKLSPPPAGPVSFPAFLNNGQAQKPQQKFNYRRASLLDGMEQTLDVSFSGRTILALPLKGTKQKLNKAFKNFISPPNDAPNRKMEILTDEESGEQSLLPIPIYSLPKPPTTRPRGLMTMSEDTVSTSAGYPSRGSTVTSVVGLVVIFLAACSLIGLVYNNFPELSDDEREKVKLPRDIEDAKELGRVLSKYKNTYHYEVMSAFFITYIFLQTFAIPGSVFLSILSGFMYPFYIALFLVCMCSGIGATGCYAISYFVGKPLVHKYLEERARKWNEVVDGQREHLFNYLLFLRITPFLPNWFINIVSPVIEIPVSTFFIATFLGVAPLSFIAIQAGTTLYQLTTAGDAISWTGIGVMAVLAVLSLLPVLLKNKLKGKFE